MRIALVAHLRHPIIEPFRGGMEAHSFHLAQALMERGHEVTLFASGDSDPRFRLRPVVAEHYDRAWPWHIHHRDPRLYDYLDNAFAAAMPEILSGNFDVVHNNSLHRFVLQGARETGRPTVTSLHVPPFDAIHGCVRASIAPTHRITVTSGRQVACWWPEGAPAAASIVHNGIAPGLWPFAPTGGGHAIWCGRITPNKGPHFAVAAARRAGMGLRLFGYIEDRAYFDAEIAPHLGGGIVYGGAVDGAVLAEEMRAAAVLLFTPCWDEPFGLVAIEAMASGLPVAAFDEGAAREVIGEEAGRFAGRGDVPGLERALTDAADVARQVPRARFEAHFTVDAMVGKYLKLYDIAIAARAGSQGCPG